MPDYELFIHLTGKPAELLTRFLTRPDDASDVARALLCHALYDAAQQEMVAVGEQRAGMAIQ